MAKKKTSKKPVEQSKALQKSEASGAAKPKPITPLVVGVGASAGGLEAIQELLRSFEKHHPAGIAIVLVQHLDTGSVSLLEELLQLSTSMSIKMLKRSATIEAGTIYVAPAQSLLDIRSGKMRVTRPKTQPCPDSPIDHFLGSLAEDQTTKAIGIILSGNGTDGTIGLKAISDAGGLTFAQEPESAKYESMPRNAAATGVADHILSPREIAEELVSYANHVASFSKPNYSKQMQNDVEEAVPRIAEVLLSVTNHNFQHYKTSTLVRRILRRMQVVKIERVNDYVALVKDDADEAWTLFRDLLIGVTQFFRDEHVFAALGETALAKIFENHRYDEPVRIWVAGCATGEEAYTIAMLCREKMEAMEKTPEVQIFASDIDERALQIARQGAYSVGIKEDITESRLKKFFVKRGKQYHVKKEIRELVLFSPHNLISDPPFSKLNLISCRNLLIYLGPHLQKKLIPLFHFALRPNGYLLLGPSESISCHRELFRALDAKSQIAQRKSIGTGKTEVALKNSCDQPSGLVFGSEQGGATIVGSRAFDVPNRPSNELIPMMQRIVLDEFAPKSVIVDEAGQILCASADMDKYLTVSGGNFHNNIVRMARKGLRVGLRTALAEASEHKRRVVHEDLSVRVDHAVQRVMLTVQPMPQLGEDDELLLVVFHDIGTPLTRNSDRRQFRPG